MNPDLKGCPTELKLSVANLILEITCFIRDVLPNIHKCAAEDPEKGNAHAATWRHC